jgi:RNA polymerase sigma-70 factor (sigma-E family)
MRRKATGTGEHDESFAAFVRSAGDRHLRMAILLTGSQEAGEDLLQSSLLKLYRAWPRLDVSVSGPDAYLRKIIVNTWRSWWRTRWWHEEPVPEVPEQPSSEDPADRLVIGTVVQQLLMLLPKQQRAALVLRYFADLPETEVAQLLGCSAGTVKTHASRGLRMLRLLLAAELPVRPAVGGADDESAIAASGLVGTASEPRATDGSSA